MHVSDEGVDLIKEFEGCYLKAYLCPAHVWTIGIGHTSAAGYPPVSKGMHISSEEAIKILKSDLEAVEDDVLRLVKVPLSQNQFDVLVSFVFNCGAGALRKSTLLKKLNNKRYDDIPSELMKWTRGGGKELPGLVRRRRAEAKLWRSHSEEVEDPEQMRASPDAPPPARNISQSKEATGAVVAGGAAGVAGLSEVASAVKENTDVLSTLSSAVGKPAFIAMIVIVIACAGIWYWRKQRMDQEAG